MQQGQDPFGLHRAETEADGNEAPPRTYAVRMSPVLLGIGALLVTVGWSWVLARRRPRAIAWVALTASSYFLVLQIVGPLAAALSGEPEITETLAHLLYRDGEISFNRHAELVDVARTQALLGYGLAMLGAFFVEGIGLLSFRPTPPEVPGEVQVVGSECDHCHARIRTVLDGVACQKCRVAFHHGCLKEYATYRDAHGDTCPRCDSPL